MPWRIEASPEDLRRLASDPAFAELLTLGRIANLVRSTLFLGLEGASAESTAADRHRVALLLLLTGLLTEALPVFERSGKHFRAAGAWQTHIRPFLTDAALQALRRDVLTPLRNQAVFHNDEAVSREGLTLLRPAESQAIAEGSSDQFMDVYYPTSDVVAFMFLINRAAATGNPAGFLHEASRGILGLARQVCVGIDALAAEVLPSFGLEFNLRATAEAEDG